MTIDLVLGLGNPGEEYARTRHNVGFLVVGELLRRGGPAEWVNRQACELAVVTPGRMVALARPQTFMNRSGAAARWLLGEFGLEPDQMLVVVDDIDLPLATLRLRRSGGPGTHNGLRDLCREVGDDYPRLRVGVRGATMVGDLADFVTSPFDAAEVEIAGVAVERAADAVEAALRGGFDAAMNTYNRPSDESTRRAPRPQTGATRD